MNARRGTKLTRGAVGNWELGGGIEGDNITLIAQLTGYSADYLWTGSGPRKDAAPPKAEAGERLRRIQDTFEPLLASKISVNSSAAWEALLNSLSIMHPHLAKEVADATGLPLSYVEHGVIADLTRPQLEILFAGAPRQPSASEGGSHKPTPSSRPPRPSAGRRRSS